MRIWKYLIEITDEQTIQLPKGAKVLTVQTQDGHPYIWALVDPDAGTEQRDFVLYGTGHEFDPESLVYVGTFQIHGGRFVFHLFERP